MKTTYTLAVWRVQPGREDDFIERWRRLAEQTLEDFPDATGTLLRDQDQPSRFISFGPWESLEQVAAWRSSAGFQRAVAGLKEVLEGFEPGTYALVMKAGR